MDHIRRSELDENVRQIWISLLPKLSRVERRQLLKEIRVRLWKTRLLTLRRIPVVIKLGLSYSLLVFLTIVLVPLPAGVPLFIPILIGAVGCLAINLVIGFNLVMSILMYQLRPQVPPFNGLDTFSTGEEQIQSQAKCEHTQQIQE